MDENFEIAPESTHEENETSTATVKFGEKSRSVSASNLIFFLLKNYHQKEQLSRKYKHPVSCCASVLPHTEENDES